MRQPEQEKPEEEKKAEVAPEDQQENQVDEDGNPVEPKTDESKITLPVYGYVTINVSLFIFIGYLKFFFRGYTAHSMQRYPPQVQLIQCYNVCESTRNDVEVKSD